MKSRSVFIHATDCVEAYPQGLDFGPLETDLDAILNALSKRHRVKLFEQLSRVEVLARLAYGAQNLIRILASATVEEQTLSGHAISEAAKHLWHHYPVEKLGAGKVGSDLVVTLGGMPLPPKSGEGDTSQCSSPRGKEGPPCDHDTEAESPASPGGSPAKPADE